MQKIWHKVAGTGLLAVALGSGGASALPFISGGIGFSDGFHTTGTTTSIVSQLVSVDINTSTLAQACSGDFGAGCFVIGSFANDFTIGVNSLIYQYGAFTFTVPGIAFGVPLRTALTCVDGKCSDNLQFLATGVVSAAGFADTAFTLNWNAGGTCNENPLKPGECGSNVTPTWNSNLVALGHSTVPEPGTLALIGVALTGLGFARRRKQS